MKNILILGGQGFIGHNLVHHLLKQKKNIFVFTKKIDPDFTLSGVRYIEGNFLNIRGHSDIFDGIDAVYHLISCSKPNSEISRIPLDVSQDLQCTVELLTLCVEKKIKKVIFSSSGGTVYGKTKSNIPICENHDTSPMCSYGIAKLAIEKYLGLFYRLYGLQSVSLRIANPFGPFHRSENQGIIDVFSERILNDLPIDIWGDGNIVRDYIYVDDVCRALVAALDSPFGNHIFNIGSGQGKSINDILSLLAEIFGKKVNVNYMKSRMIDVPYNVLDCRLALKTFNWKPEVSLVDGILKNIN